MTPEEREQRIRELAEAFASRLRQTWPEGEADITRIEEIAGELGTSVSEAVTEELGREQAERAEGNQTLCPCGQVARYRGHYGLGVLTAHGRLRVARAYFYCNACGHGFCPLDRRWGLGPAHATPTVQARLTALAAHLPYTQVPAVLAQLGLRLRIDVKSVEAIAQRVGAALAETPATALPEATGALAAAVDGVMLPTRQGYKEARCGVVYEPQWNADRSPEACAALRKEYVATTREREQLVREVCQRVERRRPAGAPVAALGDGAAWIWRYYAKYLPERVEILDFYHVAERLGALAAALYPHDAPAAQQWRRTQEAQLLQWGPGDLLRWLRAWQPTTCATRELRRVQLGFFEHQQKRMDYPRYLREGWPIGSGAVEGACKHLVTDRFKGTGMRWNLETAEPLLRVRAALLTNPKLDLRPYTRESALAQAA
jgi:hypothetical protein